MADHPELDLDALELAYKKVEDAVVDFRDRRMGILDWHNGIVCRERDGTESGIVRMKTRHAIRLAVNEYLTQSKKTQ